MAKTLPEVHLAEVELSDASPEAAQEFLFASLPARMRAAVPRGDPQTLSALRILGGRYNDLLQLVRGMENAVPGPRCTRRRPRATGSTHTVS